LKETPTASSPPLGRTTTRKAYRDDDHNRNLSFDNVEYDADADVLYLSVGKPRMPSESFGTPEGHNIRYDETGAVIAITIVNAKWLLDRDGEIKPTIPSRVPAADLALALAG
jgi:uncharacterized protein YuzE